MEKDGEARRRAWSGGWGAVKLKKKSERKFEEKDVFHGEKAVNGLGEHEGG